MGLVGGKGKEGRVGLVGGEGREGRGGAGRDVAS